MWGSRLEVQLDIRTWFNMVHQNACNLPGLDAVTNIFNPNAILGVEMNFNSSNPAMKRIDVNGNYLPTGFTPIFDSHLIWGNIKRCTLNAAGTATFGTNARGDGLTLSSDYVMVRYPRFYWKTDNPGTNRYRYWISPTAYTGFNIHPWFYQRGHSASPLAQAYLGAYEAYDAGSSKLGSKTGQTALVSQTMSTFETRGNNIGTGWGIEDIWALSARLLLYYIEYAHFDSQSQTNGIGAGVSNAGAAKATGADSANTNINPNGTGQGTGTNDNTPVVWRGLENPWGNLWHFTIGYNTTPDNQHYRILNPDGSGTPAETQLSGSLLSTAAPVTGISGTYSNAILYESLMAGLFISITASGSASTYMCDGFYSHVTNQTNVLLSGGGWNGNNLTGVAYLYLNAIVGVSVADLGARLEFLG